MRGIREKQEELDGYLAKYAINWSVSRISKVARAILHVAMYEALYVDDVPVDAAISEAVELTRKYEDEDVVAFVNGILGSLRPGSGENQCIWGLTPAITPLRWRHSTAGTG